MKKNKMGRLSLKRETIRDLLDDELTGVAGGAVSAPMSICVTYSKPARCTQAYACASAICG
jgi:hypothetical protein